VFIHFGTNRFTEYVFPTLQTMTEALKSEYSRFSILGDDLDEPQEFRIIAAVDEARSEAQGIGLCMKCHGVAPLLILTQTADHIGVAFNEEVDFISLDFLAVTSRVRFDSLFMKFIPSPTDAFGFAVCEADVYVFSENGEVHWHQDMHDLVLDARIEREQITVVLMDSPPVHIDIQTGRLLK
jgi:hypothetical protein